MSDDDHYLDSYLTEVLPRLGLDAEMYTPYVTGFADDDGDDDAGLDDLIELLRASSETHSDDDAAWIEFREEFERRKKEHVGGEEARKEEEINGRRREEERVLEEEIRLAKEHEIEVELKKKEDLLNRDNLSAEKRALMEKFGWCAEDDDADAGGGGTGGGDGGKGGDGGDAAPASNREYAAQMAKEHSKKQRSMTNTVSKSDSRVETKKAKDDKKAQKEARRKRATKGERKA